MLLRAKDVDIATIALWLGHESTQTTRIYEHADPALKDKDDMSSLVRIARVGPAEGGRSSVSNDFG
jgi:integrase